MIIRSTIKIIALCILPLSCLESKDTTFSPSNKTWVHDGAHYEGLEMFFRPDGVLVFKKGYKWLNPTKWEYNSKKKEIKLIIPKADQDTMETFKANASLYKYPNVENPKAIDMKNKTVTYNFPARKGLSVPFHAAVKKEKRITFDASFKPAVAWLEDFGVSFMRFYGDKYQSCRRGLSLDTSGFRFNPVPVTVLMIR